MAITDVFGGAGLVTNILMKLRVDTTEAKEGLKDLTGEEKKAAQAAVELQEKKNKQMESWSKGIAKVTVGMQLAQKAVGLLGDAWKAYEKAAKEAGGADAAKAREFRSALDSMGKAVDKFAVALGGIVANLAPLVDLAAEFVSLAAQIISLPGRAAGYLTLGAGPSGAKAIQGFNEFKKYGDPRLFGEADFYGPGGRQAMSSMQTAQQGLIDARMAGMGVILRNAKTEMNKPKADPWSMGELGGIPFDAARAMGRYTTRGEQREQSQMSWFNQPLGKDAGSGLGVSDDMLSKAIEGMGVEGLTEKQKTMLERLIGPIDQFSLYADAIAGFTGAIQGSFDAWVSGSLTAGQAIKKFFSDAVSGVASQMFAEAIKHGAFAIGSLAFGDIRGAATHGKAAAAFGAGAIAVGAIARQLNGGGASAGTGGGVPSVTGGGGGGGGGGQTTNVFLVGDGLSDDSPRMRRQSFGRQMRMSRGSLQDSSGVRDG